MSKKYDAFIFDLIDLCRQHHVQLTTSGYDLLQVWDRELGESAIHGGIEDKTKETT